MCPDSLSKGVRPGPLGLDRSGLDTPGEVAASVQGEEGQDEHLPDDNGKKAQGQAERLRIVRRGVVLVPTRREHLTVGSDAKGGRQHQRERQEERPEQHPRPRKQAVIG